MRTIVVSSIKSKPQSRSSTLASEDSSSLRSLGVVQRLSSSTLVFRFLRSVALLKTHYCLDPFTLSFSVGELAVTIAQREFSDALALPTIEPSVFAELWARKGFYVSLCKSG